MSGYVPTVVPWASLACCARARAVLSSMCRARKASHVDRRHLCPNRPGTGKWVNRFHACFNNFAPAAFDALASKVQNGNA